MKLRPRRSKTKAKTKPKRRAKAKGRPTSYKDEFCQKAADLCVNGATDFEVAQALGVCVRTLYRWKAEHSDFCQALKIGKEAADDRVERSLYNRAVGYDYPAVKIMQDSGKPLIVPYTEHVPPDVGAVTMWLTNRKGWRTKQSHEHTGANGGPIMTQSADDLTDEQLAVIASRGSPAPPKP